MPNVAYFTGQDDDIAAEITRHAPSGYRVSKHSMSLPDSEKTPIVADSDYLILFPGRISDPVLRAGTKLRLIQLVSAGFEHMPLALCDELGIPVANNGGTNSTDVAEHTLALILGQYRRMVELDRKMRSDPALDVPVASRGRRKRIRMETITRAFDGVVGDLTRQLETAGVRSESGQ